MQKGARGKRCAGNALDARPAALAVAAWSSNAVRRMHACQRPPAASQHRLSTEPLTVRCVLSPRRRQAHAGPVLVTEAGSFVACAWPSRWPTPPTCRRALQRLTTELQVIPLTPTCRSQLQARRRPTASARAARSRTLRARAVGGGRIPRIGGRTPPRTRACPRSGLELSEPEGRAPSPRSAPTPTRGSRRYFAS